MLLSLEYVLKTKETMNFNDFDNTIITIGVGINLIFTEIMQLWSDVQPFLHNNGWPKGLLVQKEKKEQKISIAKAIIHVNIHIINWNCVN